MIKKEIYPKTPRVKCDGEKVQLTEKLDGNNLCIFKLNDELYIAQRNTIFRYNELLEKGLQGIYKGLYQWLLDNKEALDDLNEKSAICGEWLGMGQLKYSVDEFDKRYYMFAKANVDENCNLFNFIYDHEQFIYPFQSQEIPNCIGIVPIVKDLTIIPNKEQLDGIYEKYCQKVGRNVEGFVMNYRNQVAKYVRMKNGKLREHFDWKNNKEVQQQ